MIYVCKECGSRKTEQPYKSSGELLYTCALCVEKNKKKDFKYASSRRNVGSELFSNINRIRKIKTI